jgi:hypothetical protein
VKPYRPLRTLANLASASMLALSICNLAITAAGAQGAFQEDNVSIAGAVVALVLALGVFASLVLGAVFFGMWMNRAAHNVRALGHMGFEISPGFGVGSFFIPILNLWKPYQAMQDIWRASNAGRGDSWLSVPTGDIVKGWWAAWLLAGFLGRATSASDDFGAIDVAVALLTFAAAGLCIAMMRAVNAAQEAQHGAPVANVTVGDAVGHTPLMR